MGKAISTGTLKKGVQQAFLRQLSAEDEFGLLFDLLPEVYFFAKDAEGRFVRMNPALVRAIGYKSESEVLGLTDHDLFSPSLAELYRREDQRVMSTDKPALNEVWVVPNQEGVLTWYLSNKIPLHDRTGKVIGIAGAMRDMRTAGAVIGPYEELREAVEYVTRHYAEPLEVKFLARLVNLSERQFNRRFRSLFRLSPVQYQIQLRVQHACRDLERTGESISMIASRHGFYDQSSFVRQFRARMGTTPSQFRSRLRRQRKPNVA